MRGSRTRVSTESVDDILSRESSERERVERESVKKQQEIALEKREEQAKNREEQARRAEMAKPYPRIGMTREQIVKRRNWGAPSNINRTITAGASENNGSTGLDATSILPMAF